MSIQDLQGDCSDNLAYKTAIIFVSLKNSTGHTQAMSDHDMIVSAISGNCVH